MSIQINSVYRNPLTMVTSAQQRNIFFGKNKSADQTTDLQIKQQHLQNTLLLMKSTGSDSSISTEAQQEKLEVALEKVSAELRSVKNDISQDRLLSSTEKVQMSNQTLSDLKLRDTYEKSTQAEIGIYQLKREENAGYHISFVPYHD